MGILNIPSNYWLSIFYACWWSFYRHLRSEIQWFATAYSVLTCSASCHTNVVHLLWYFDVLLCVPPFHCRRSFDVVNLSHVPLQLFFPEMNHPDEQEDYRISPRKSSRTPKKKRRSESPLPSPVKRQKQQIKQQIIVVDSEVFHAIMLHLVEIYSFFVTM